MFVFGEVQDPNMDTVNLVEDIVRSQLIELVRMQPEYDATMLLNARLGIDCSSSCSRHSSWGAIPLR
jgi:hypothetical protein